MTFRALFLKPDSRRGPSAFVLTVALVFLAIGLSAELGEQFGGPVLIVMTMPIILSAYWGGFWPGVVATMTAVFAANYFLLAPVGSFAVASPLEQVKEIILVVGGFLISAICERLHQERRRAERAHEAAERGRMAMAQLAAIIASSEDAIVGKDLDGTITSWNRASERMFGYSAAEMIGAPIARLIPPELMHEEVQIIARLKEGQTIDHFETRRRCKNGSEILVSLSVSPIRDAGGRIVGAAKIARDITGQKEAEAHLRMLQAELAHVARLDTMGEMSAALAHEINQPLTATSNYVRAAQRLLTDECTVPRKLSMTREAMQKAADQIQRTGKIIRRLREFVEKRDVERAVEDLNEVVQSAVELGLMGVAAGDVKTDSLLAPERLMVEIDRIQIQQVLVNLIRNATEAMAASAERRLIISTRRDGASAMITVRDTGPGLSAEVLSRLFKPFTTTKKDGMGIGLSICRSIMTAHGGSIQGVSDGGAVFELHLPLSDVNGLAAAL